MTYLFSTRTPGLVRSDLVFMWVGAVFVIASIIIKGFVVKQLAGSPKKILLNRCYHLFLTIGLLVMLWFGFRYENIPWLSAHVAVLGLFLMAGLWFVFIARFYFRNYKTAQKSWADEQLKKKYLAR